MKHRFSVPEYYRMPETGILPPEARVELLNGLIIDLPKITPFHGGITMRLNQWFNMGVPDRAIVSIRNPVRLDNYSEPQPDLALLKPVPDFYRSRHPLPEDVFLLVEVSDTSLADDWSEKLTAYGHAGIPEVWIVNLNDQTVEMYREPHLSGYAGKSVLSPGDIAQPLAFPDLTVNVSELVRR